MKSCSRMVSLVIIGTVVFLAAGSGAAVAHEEHGESTPETPLEPSDGPERSLLTAGGIAVTILLATGVIYIAGIACRRNAGIASATVSSLLGRIVSSVRSLGKNREKSD